MEEEYLYPKVNFSKTAFNNETTANVKQHHNLREKFCLKISRKERETEKILTVFERKALGNEKIYEKRLNFTGGSKEWYSFALKSMEFHPNGDYLYLKFWKYGAITLLKT